jgi:branched-subunit amino acid ABC-type transport system permease component
VSAASVFGQMMSGLTSAMFLFLIASGLSLVFGVMRVINFAHGSFYMLGAYLAWQAVRWFQPAGAAFWAAALVAALGVALLGGIVERLLLRHLYGRDELYQLLLTYALVLILGDVAKFVWGTGQLSVARPPVLAGSVQIFGTTQPAYNLFIMAFGLAIAVFGWLALTKSGAGRLVRAAAYDREMLDALGANVGAIYTGMFVVSSFLAGLSGALVTPIESIVPGMDVLIIVQAFIVVVIGGMGSFWGTFWGSVIYGQVLSFGILIYPAFSLFSVFALMAVILIIRPWGLFGRPLR